MQGPLSPYFERLALALIDLGHDVRRVNLCCGDQLMWRRLPADDYTGTAEEWPEYVRAYILREQVSDLLFLGDRRPMHMAAAAVARELGVRVFATELGYLRPDWITLERNGMSLFSHFPSDPAAIRAIAALVPPATLKPLYKNNFTRMAYWDLAYNLSNLAYWRRFPHYRWHAIYHPLSEYAGWVWRLVRRPYLSRDADSKIGRLQHSKAPYYFYPLQLETDYQIRAHSPYQGQLEPIGQVLRSFARKAPQQSKLLFKVHPLDNGLINWRREIEQMAAISGVSDRVSVVDGGDLAQILPRAKGVITINSTVGTAALAAGRPLIALGSAIFVVEGLTFSGNLDEFWSGAKPPDAPLFQDLVRALAGTIQIKGGYFDESALDAAVRGSAQRLHDLTVNEPAGFVDPAPRLATAEK